MEAPSSSQVSGLPHAPSFRANIDVAGPTFTATKTFESLSRQASVNMLSSSFLKGFKLWKTILYKYSAKKKGQMELPFYQTGVPESGPTTVFVTKVTFENNTFVGPLSKSKREAEHNAARVVISSLLENAESRCLMSEVIQRAVPLTTTIPEPDPNQNPNPNSNPGTLQHTHARSAIKPEEVTETNLPLPPSFWTVPNKLSKSILKEYCDKKKFQDPPLYNTHTLESGAPATGAFTACVSIEGFMYPWGPQLKSKKEAEQAAALVAIKSILGDPESRNLMLQAMQSKTEINPSSSDVNLISDDPSSNPNNPNPVNPHLYQPSANPKDNQVENCSVGPTASEIGESKETTKVVENLSEVRPTSKKAGKRARKKERMREAKKVKTDC